MFSDNPFDAPYRLVLFVAFVVLKLFLIVALTFGPALAEVRLIADGAIQPEVEQ